MQIIMKIPYTIGQSFRFTKIGVMTFSHAADAGYCSPTDQLRTFSHSSGPGVGPPRDRLSEGSVAPVLLQLLSSRSQVSANPLPIAKAFLRR